MPNSSRSRQSAPLMALGKAIRQARKSVDLSQGELALEAGVDRAYLSRVERGDNAVSILTLIKIARALGLTVAKLMAKAKL